MTKLPRLPLNYKNQPQLFERFWDNVLTGLEKNITTTDNITLDINSINTSIASLNTSVSSLNSTVSSLAISVSSIDIRLSSIEGLLLTSMAPKLFLASPAGSSGVASFRVIDPIDVPTLNQNTTGTSSNVTGIVAVVNGGTGASTAGTARTNLGFSDGTYTPTLTNTTNITASTANVTNYYKIGSMVTVAGQVAIQATAAGAIVLKMSLPVSSNFASSPNAAGTISAITSGKIASGGVLANTATKEFEIRIPNVPDTTNINYSFSFTYQII